MFTGIISDVGTILNVESIPAGKKFELSTQYDPGSIEIGASIACSGVCHTVIEKGEDGRGRWFSIESARETLKLTTVSNWKAGDRINLERSLSMGDELGGHLVPGHVDGKAEIVEFDMISSESLFVKFRVPLELSRFIAKKGSVALDGTSLTVNEVGRDTFSVLLIPHTLKVTTWGDRAAGDFINLEVDMMARYVSRLQEFDTKDCS
ncbi:MAG: riboflavin synthase [Hyphomicrobiales bacterium]|nr:MAG: riboflavin synthase [Hyphomicrobiales bacterium]